MSKKWMAIYCIASAAVIIAITIFFVSTGVACANTGRRFIGIEKDDHWFEVARDRIEQAFNETGGDT